MDKGMIIAAIPVLVMLTNMLVNVIKGWGGIFAKNAQITVTIVAELLTEGALFAYLFMNDMAGVWYMYFIGAIVGFIVSYCAMYGYDELYANLVKYLKGTNNTTDTPKDDSVESK